MSQCMSVVKNGDNLQECFILKNHFCVNHGCDIVNVLYVMVVYGRGTSVCVCNDSVR